MAEINLPTDQLSRLRKPPLFLTVVSVDGWRHDGLLEHGERTPEWATQARSVRIVAPSGETRDLRPENGLGSDAYAECLNAIGETRAWTPALTGPVTDSWASLEVWADQGTDVDFAAGSMSTLEFRRRGSQDDRGGENQRTQTPQDGWDPLPFFVVIRNAKSVPVHVATGGLVYLEYPKSIGDDMLVPRCLLDTGLPGAFWGFKECGNAEASYLTAQRLLSSLSNKHLDVARPQNRLTIIAGSHALLTHRELWPDFGSFVLNALPTDDVDSLAMRALLDLAFLTDDPEDSARLQQDLKSALRKLLTDRPIYAETLRWLDAKYDVLCRIAGQTIEDATTRSELAALDQLLRISYIGGQVATYQGEVPLGTKVKSLDISPLKKKTGILFAII